MSSGIDNSTTMLAKPLVPLDQARLTSMPGTATGVRPVSHEKGGQELARRNVRLRRCRTVDRPVGARSGHRGRRALAVAGNRDDAHDAASEARDDENAGRRPEANTISEKAPLELPPDVFGPCFRPVRGRHVSFELGFVDPGFAGRPITLEQLDPDGPAARADLRSGDTIVELRYRSGDPSVSVTAVIEREGIRLERSYEPRGTPVPRPPMGSRPSNTRRSVPAMTAHDLLRDTLRQVWGRISACRIKRSMTWL
jgi:hypothetical protein